MSGFRKDRYQDSRVARAGIAFHMDVRSDIGSGIPEDRSQALCAMIGAAAVFFPRDSSEFPFGGHRTGVQRQDEPSLGINHGRNTHGFAFGMLDRLELV